MNNHFLVKDVKIRGSLLAYLAVTLSNRREKLYIVLLENDPKPLKTTFHCFLVYFSAAFHPGSQSVMTLNSHWKEWKLNPKFL